MIYSNSGDLRVHFYLTDSSAQYLATVESQFLVKAADNTNQPC